MRHLNKIAYRFQIWNEKIRHINIYKAVRRTLAMIFPFVVIGSIFSSINDAFFSPDGYFAQVYNFSKWFPDYKQIGSTLDALNTVTTNMISLLGVFFIAKFLAHFLNDDETMVGISGVLAYLLLNFNFSNKNMDNNPGLNRNNGYFFNNFGLRTLFLALIIGIIVAYIYHIIAKIVSYILKQKDISKLSFPKRGTAAIVPVVVILLIFAFGSYSLHFTSQNNLATIIYGFVDIPSKRFNHAVSYIFLLAIVNNLLSFIGIFGSIGLNTMNSISSISDLNFEHALANKDLYKVPYPITTQTLYGAYGSFGGSGMILALILGMIIFSKRRNLRRIARYSLFPGLVNSNSPALIGIPVLYNPILLIPFLLSPIVSMSIAWVFIRLKFMPPAVYYVPPTTPSFLVGYLGTNGNLVALFVSFLCLFVSVLIYLPYIRIIERVEDDLDRSEGV